VTPWMTTRWVIGGAALTLAAVVVWILWPHRFNTTPSFEISALSRNERAQLAELVLNISEAPQEKLAEARQEVWKILGRHGVPSPSARQNLEQIFLKIGQGTHLFWLDAQQALKEQRPVKSGARTQWEVDLLSDGWLTQEQQHRYDAFMAQVAREEPIESSHGVEIVADEIILKEIVESWDEDELRNIIFALLTPPVS